MAEEIDDNGFYREDFSVESDWEIFNAQLCELFQKWDLSNSDWGRSFLSEELFKCDWNVQKETLKVKGNEVLVAYYKADLKSLNPEISKEMPSNDETMAPMHLDLLSSNNNFEPRIIDEKAKEIHSLARFYGLRRFVVLNPRNDQNSYLTKRSEFSFYFSAISVAAAEVCSTVPIFVQIYNEKWNFFLGEGITSHMRTNFDLVALEQAPKDFCYLSGLLNMFKEKLPKGCTESATLSVRNTYSLDTVQIRVPWYIPFGQTSLEDEEQSIISLTTFTALPHGYFPYSRTENYAVFTWSNMTANMMIDSETQTYFIPSKAASGVAYQKAFVSSYLTSCIKGYHKLITSKNTLESYVGRNFSGANLLSDVANPLDQLTKTNLGKFETYRHMKHSDILGQTTINKKLPGPITERELNQLIYYLFPDLYPDVALFPYENNDLNKDPHRIKSAVTDSLVQRLSCLLATYHSHYASSGLAQLWATFTREIRLLWDCGITIRG